MRASTMILVAILVVCMLVMVYWATVGFAVARDDFDGDGSGDDGGDSDGSTQARGYFVIGWRAWVVPSTAYTTAYISGSINTVTTNVAHCTYPTQFYDIQKFDLLAPVPPLRQQVRHG